jgi:amidase
MAQALETAWAAEPALCRPRPDIDALRAPQPALRSIVTHPPGSGDSSTHSSVAAV